ncbi:unnamed protein product [Zymoseptoria tritici ST99CH_1E4]|uniref:Dipeptidyl-peptidase V n=1 Tax=Zymoseptoria tritici ST99CH_1E4 TaxID=1276532 RepID=A0A2H1GH87_ZYMTR|nr:unnamed protein product [Zymoseptoria tritici ST99CH_1E4]
MVQKAGKFTPQVLLSAPRRSAGVPNSSGTAVLYTTSTYSFQTHKKSTELRVLFVKSGDSHLLAKDDDISDLNWLDEDEFTCLQAEKDGTTSVYVASVSKVIEGSKLGHSHYIAGKIDTAAGNLQVHRLAENDFAIALSAQAYPDGTLYNPETAKKTQATGRLYTSLMVRHWDHWLGKERNAIWYGRLTRGSSSAKYEASKLTNALAKTGLESPIAPFGGTDNFTIGKLGIVFVAKDPELNPALNTKCNLYLVRVDSWDAGESRKPQHIELPGFEGACGSPIFSPDGKSVALLSMKINGYEADRNRILIVGGLGAEETVPLKATPTACAETWDRSPQSVSWTADGNSLVVTAEDVGTGKAYLITPSSREIVALTKDRYVSDVKPLANSQVFFSGSSITDNSFYGLLDYSKASAATSGIQVWSHSNTGEGSKLNLHHSQVSSIWTPASNPKVNEKVHSLVIRPSNYDSKKRYPVAYLIHGGPQGAWGDSWSTRWNPAVFAEQGYVCIAPNFTGSTGYGQAFTDAIRGQWGNWPYFDIANVFEWVGENMPEADNDRAVALGASYGGYMMNWIQGHPLGRKFKAIVCHDGITSFAGGQFSTEELYFPLHDLGVPWESNSSKAGTEVTKNFGATSTSAWRKWDPSEHFSNWATPQLVIHSSKDYRLPIGEGLAAFNVLQARGVDSQLLTFPDENHWVLKPENSLLWHKVVLNWINKYAGLPAFAEEGEESEELYGGFREAKKEVEDMPTQGKVEM